MKLINKTTEVILADNVTIADTFISRLIGLLGRSEIPLNSALVIKPCKQVHMFFMKFPIGAIFLDNHGRVLYKQHVKPWQISKKVSGAAMVVEVSLDVLDHIEEGEIIILA